GGGETHPSAPMGAGVGGAEPRCGGPTIAEGIAVARAGRLTGRIVTALVDDILTVSEEDVEEAMNLLLEIEKVVVEGAGAAGVAALVGYRERFTGKKVGVVLTGGNVDPR